MSIIASDNIAKSLKQVCEAHQVVRLRLFGSTATGRNRPDSDVDLLVEYEPGHVTTLESLDKLETDLQELFGGRKIDLVDPARLHWFIRDSVLASARVLHER